MGQRRVDAVETSAAPVPLRVASSSKPSKISQPYRDLLPPLSAEEQSVLTDSIRADGVLHPILVDEDGAIIDGHHRYAIDKTAPRRVLRGLATDAEKRAAAIGHNLNRRNLSPTQRQELAKTQRAIAKELRSEGKRQREIARLLGVPRETVRNWLDESGTKNGQSAKICTTPPHALQGLDAETYVLERRDAGDGQAAIAADMKLTQQAVSTIEKRARKRQARDQEKAEKRQAVAAAEPEELFTLHVSAIDRAHQLVAPGQVDVIVTDPPYAEKFIPLYGELARFALHALRDGGSLVVMTGQAHLPAYLGQLCAETGLRYHWCCAYLTPGGQAVQIFPRKVNTFWKPLLWFVKGDYRGDWIGDVSRSDTNDNEKRHHGWGQSDSGMADIVTRFSAEGDLVCDPFCGGGATALAAVTLRRRFLGLDIDAKAIATTEKRLAG